MLILIVTQHLATGSEPKVTWLSRNPYLQVYPTNRSSLQFTEGADPFSKSLGGELDKSNFVFTGFYSSADINACFRKLWSAAVCWKTG